MTELDEGTALAWTAMFRSTVGADGFAEEDGEAWSESGRLIAQSRRPAPVVPFR